MDGRDGPAVQHVLPISRRWREEWSGPAEVPTCVTAVRVQCAQILNAHGINDVTPHVCALDHGLDQSTAKPSSRERITRRDHSS